ncbi:MAG TPA: radical SAM protein [bacterium]|nr:radical SAM protein [bacterium]
MSQQGYIQLTRDCNQNCRFCSNPANEKRIDMDRAVELIDSFIEQGYTGIIFTGGEPTLCPFLPELVSYASRRGIPNRIITNGQKICDCDYFETLYEAGLRNVNLSLYSVRDDVQSFLSGNPDSLKNITGALQTLGKFNDVQTVINTVINKYNSDHLSENVQWVIRNAPFVPHFVWNNLDPRNSKCKENPDTIPRLNDFQLELHKAVEVVLKSGRMCRIERVPLCYMAGFEHLSTETRKIVKKEKTTTYFLDEKELFSQDSYQYGKAACCNACFLDQICAGLFEIDVFYSSEELYACFRDSGEIIDRILNDASGQDQNSVHHSGKARRK